ncbi:hypothetical protein [Enterococcus durans]|uniref:hypothetical protein n=1 Tax=Enterococcus durans TaxID=53345 RepID=UPI000B32FB25|nr:hypothetical protein [Enterococcus durans]
MNKIERKEKSSGRNELEKKIIELGTKQMLKNQLSQTSIKPNILPKSIFFSDKICRMETLGDTNISIYFFSVTFKCEY